MLFTRGQKNNDIQYLKDLLNDRYGANLVEDNHFDLEMEATIRTFQRRFDLDPDGIIGPLTHNILYSQDRTDLGNPILHHWPVPYLTQRDNRSRPLSTCGPTCCAMVLSSLGISSPNPAIQLEDHLFSLLNSDIAIGIVEDHFPWALGKYNSWNIHGMLKWVMERFPGIHDRFGKRTPSRMDALLEEGPLITSGYFTGSGHVIVIVGLTQDKDYIVHDPYGSWEAGYHKRITGKDRIYNREKMQAVLKAYSHQVLRDDALAS